MQQGQIPCKKTLWGHLYETVKVKPKLKWKFKDVGDAGAMGDLALAYTRQIQETKCVTSGRA